ncbi:MAG: FG-GAP repeat protein [Planctomycetes bacterium]|nr:FG-GAP repeat protein [Planctomycetota bacterium]
MYSAKSDGKKGCRVRLRPGRNCTLVAIIFSLGAAPALAQFVEVQKLAVSDETAAEWFGRSVSVSGNTAVVGAWLDDCAAGHLRIGVRVPLQRDLLGTGAEADRLRRGGV